jgi:hypothetical protein
MLAQERQFAASFISAIAESYCGGDVFMYDYFETHHSMLCLVLLLVSAGKD